MRRGLVLAIFAGLLLVGCQGAAGQDSSATPKPAAVAKATVPDGTPAASPSGSPAAKPSPSPSPAAGGSGASSGPWILTTDGLLSVTGIVLTAIVALGWVMANRAEAMPTAEQSQELLGFIRQHFARYVAQGLLGGDQAPTSVSRDPAWRKIFVQHLRLHNELYAVRRDVALRVYEQEIDAAVRSQLASLRAGDADPAAEGG